MAEPLGTFAGGERPVAAPDEVREIRPEAFGDGPMIAEIFEFPYPPLVEGAGAPGEDRDQDHSDERCPAGVPVGVDSSQPEDCLLYTSRCV